MSRCILGWWQTRSDESDSHKPAHQAYESKDSCGPAKADALEQGSEHEGEDNASDTTRRRCKPSGEATPCFEPMANRCDAGSEGERRAQAAEDAKRQDELVQLWGPLVSMCRTRTHAHMIRISDGVYTPGWDRTGFWTRVSKCNQEQLPSNYLPVQKLMPTKAPTVQAHPATTSHFGPYLSKTGPI